MNKPYFILATLVLALSATVSVAQTTTITYQGRFTDSGNPANGPYDMQFKLYDSPSGVGSIVGGNLINGVQVTSGVFTVQLDFGIGTFTGADRYLEIGVRPVGSADPYTLLSPRQLITSAPYAIRSANATLLGGVAASQYVQTFDPRLSDSRPPKPNSSSYIQNTSSPQQADFNISGNGKVAGLFTTSALNASDYSLGGKRVLFANSTNLHVGWDNSAFPNQLGPRNTTVGAEAGQLMNGSETDNSFLGYKAGAVNSGSDNSIFGSNAGSQNQSGNQNSFFGSFAGAFNKNGNANAFFGARAGSLNSGSYNSFFGDEAGSYNETANDIAYFGYRAGFRSTGATNSMFGSSAGFETTTGFANSFFGKDAGFGNDTGFDNVFVGRGAGSANISGNDNTIVGTGADLNSGGLSFATAIGSGAKVGTSNTIVLGRSNGSDGVQVPGTLTVSTLGVAGAIGLCRNVLNQISTCSSSLRYKTNIQPFIGGLSVLNRLRPITFDWKQGGMHDLGFGAEDVAAVEPLLVTRNDKGEVEGVKYDRITAVLVNAVKEQQEQIKQQQNEIASLKALVCQRHRRARVCN